MRGRHQAHRLSTRAKLQDHNSALLGNPVLPRDFLASTMNTSLKTHAGWRDTVSLLVGKVGCFDPDIPKLEWIDSGEKIITYKGEKLNYDFLGNNQGSDEIKGLIESDDEK